MHVAAVEISESIQRGIDDLVGFLPRLVGFLIILLIGYLVAKALAKVVQLALEKVGADRALRSSTTGEYMERVAPDLSPSELTGKVVFWFIFLGALSIAISSLGITALNDFLADVFSYLPNVVAAILIFVVAAALASFLARAVAGAMGDTPTGRLVATAVPALVMAIAVFMILNQLKIATDVVTITYAALMGALALGMALAFGLGGRDVASRVLEDAYRRGQQERERIRAQRATIQPTERTTYAPTTEGTTYAPSDTPRRRRCGGSPASAITTPPFRLRGRARKFLRSASAVQVIPRGTMARGAIGKEQPPVARRKSGRPQGPTTAKPESRTENGSRPASQSRAVLADGAALDSSRDASRSRKYPNAGAPTQGDPSEPRGHRL